MTIKEGARVYVKGVGPGRVGRVVYVRFAPPDFTTPCAYSVVLDANLGRPGYVGTVYSAELVSLAEEE
jgi:hypothetical protein